MNPLGALLTLLASLAVLALPTRQAMLSVFAGICYITQGQTIDVGGFHFTAIRLVLLFGFVRILARGELKSIRMNNLDWALMGFTIVSTVSPGIRTGLWQELIGGAYNILLSYFVFRALITSWEDLEALVKGLAVLIIPLMFFMLLESRSGQNIFNYMGGRDQTVDWVREGRYRCVGSFRGPHTAGTFGATLVPLFVGVFFVIPQHRARMVVGIIAGSIITYTANASGALMAYMSCAVGLMFWPMRNKMKLVRKGIVVFLVVLSFTMKAPIWYIFSKMSDITGGDGWYRSRLMEQCWNHMADWWLIGTNDTSDWAATLMSNGQADLCNLYVSCAAGAGMAGLVLLIVLLTLCFRYLGLSLAAARKSESPHEILLWGLGAALFGHVVTLFSVTYFDQLHVAWWGLIAIISSVSSAVVANSGYNESAHDEESLATPDVEPDQAEAVL